MSTMNISLPEALKRFVEEKVSGGSYGAASEYDCELIRKEREREQIHALLLEGAGSPPTTPVDEDFFVALRRRARGE